VKQSKAFVSFDLLFAALPVLIMLSYLFTVIAFATEAANTYQDSAELTQKLSSIADYLVKRGAVERQLQGTEFLGTASYRPNVIDEVELGKFQYYQAEELGGWMGIENLEASFEAGEGTCVYRLVVVGEELELRKLYVCGEAA